MQRLIDENKVVAVVGGNYSSSALAMMSVAVFFLPQLDPFGKNEERQQHARERDLLEQTIKATEKRAALLACKHHRRDRLPEGRNMGNRLDELR